MTTFVYVYLDRVSQSDELRWSIRSVKKHFLGESEIVIAGDRPSWFKGRCLNIKRHAGSRYADTHRKLAKAAKEGISDKFVWMMDDIYFLRDFKLEELEINRYGRKWTKNDKGVIIPALRAKSGWQKVKQRTVKLLMSNGHDTVYDYATHMPHLMEVEKHKEIFEKYKLESGRHLHELIYGNEFPGPSKRPVSKTLCYINRPQKTPSGYRAKIGDCWIANNNNRAWTPVLRTYLSSLFPEISENELTDAGEVGKKRIVTSKKSPNFGMSKREVMIQKMMAGENVHEELAPERTASNFSCEYKGEFIRKVNGSKCGKRGGVDVFACQLNGEATREKAVQKIKSCNQCHIFQNWLEFN
jgi:hypothetical protein